MTGAEPFFGRAILICRLFLATGYPDLPNASDRDLVRLPKPFSQAQLNSSILAAVLDRK
jgi:hypothetical protein